MRQFLIGLVSLLLVGCAATNQNVTSPPTLWVINNGYRAVTIYEYTGPMDIITRDLTLADRDMVIRRYMRPVNNSKIMPNQAACIKGRPQASTVYAAVGIANDPFLIMRDAVRFGYYKNWVWDLTGSRVGDEINHAPGPAC